MAYYSSKKIRATGAQYMMIFGKRSNGKTYDSIYNALVDYWESGCVNQTAYIRRWKDDFTGVRGATMFNNLVCNEKGENSVDKITGGVWAAITYSSSRWYLSRYDDDLQKQVLDDKPFCYAFSLSAMEHDKSTSYPFITNIIFDEFISRGTYLNDEFVIFMNVISTIVRNRLNVKILMLANSVNLYCPYFDEMGITNLRKMKQGDIDVYNYGDSGLRVAVEYVKYSGSSKESNNMLFAFNNPKLQMITSGVWEMAIYPTCPIKFNKNDIVFTYFIIFSDYILQCEIISKNDLMFTYIHKKTTPLRDSESDLIYSTEYSPRENWKRNILKPTTKYEKLITDFYRKDKIFYQDNITGEAMRNYLLWCKSA